VFFFFNKFRHKQTEHGIDQKHYLFFILFIKKINQQNQTVYHQFSFVRLYFWKPFITEQNQADVFGLDNFLLKTEPNHYTHNIIKITVNLIWNWWAPLTIIANYFKNFFLLKLFWFLFFVKSLFFIWENGTCIVDVKQLFYTENR
jgi:hypothetical protein